MWYDLETDYDYVFLEASTDGGKTWEILTTPSGTGEDPSGNSYGWGYNGQTNGWVDEKVDLSQFAGQKVQIRFEYVTDAALNGEGFLLDDVQIDAINYQSDFETDDGGWEAAGFVRVENVLPQTYRLSSHRQGRYHHCHTDPGQRRPDRGDPAFAEEWRRGYPGRDRHNPLHATARRVSD